MHINPVQKQPIGKTHIVVVVVGILWSADWKNVISPSKQDYGLFGEKGFPTVIQLIVV